MVTVADIEAAAVRLTGLITRTPLLPFAAPDAEADGARVWLKAENLQPIGSFKLRGAGNRLLALSPAERARGVVAYSSGNHAQGVAYTARHLGMAATIVVPTTTPRVKLAATRALGAEVVLYDPATEQREAVAERVRARLPPDQLPTLVPPFDDPYIIAGQGTAGLEIFEDLPTADLVLVPVGGGGLLSGIATALKARNPAVRIIGVEPVLAADAQASFRAGHRVAWPAADTQRTLADGVRTLEVGALPFALIQRYVDDIVTVTEAEIRTVTRRLALEARLVVEPTGALALAAWLYHRAELPPARQVVALLTGGNIDPELLIELLQG
ncbi:MAG: threonine/serine dehydratase [Hymenobacteraceae bacterium]|nr:threonine/serine dehydratase [Hymenobacteraceae bacterium]